MVQGNAEDDFFRDNATGAELPAWAREYWLNGFAVAPRIFDENEIARLRDYFDEWLHLSRTADASGKMGHSEFRFIDVKGDSTLKFVKWPSASHKGLDGFRTSPKLLAVISVLLGRDLRQVVNQMHWKNPGDGVSFQMHQDCTFRKPDSAYADLFHSFAQSAIAVDASTPENGCIQFLAGSHLEARALLTGGYEGWDANASNRQVLESFGPAVDAVMESGDVLLWNPYVIHGSQANTGKNPRRLYINGFVKADCSDRGVEVMKGDRVMPLFISPETLWDQVEH